MWNEQLEPVYKKVFSNLVADNHKAVLGNLDKKKLKLNEMEKNEE